MLKKVITTTALATVLLTSSISANELATQGSSTDIAKVEAFQGIPSQGLNHIELNERGEWIWVAVSIGVSLAPYAYEAWELYDYHQNQQNQQNEYYEYY